MNHAPLANRFVALVTVAAALLAPNAHADGWAVGAGALEEFRSSPAAEFALEGGERLGVVPEFRSGARDRSELTFAASVDLARRLRVSADWAWLWDHSPATDASGPGDIRLGTAIGVLPVGRVLLGLGWEAKMPNAANEAELGTDETDVTVGLWGGWQSGPWSVAGAAGLAVLGNPLRFANQDDVPLLRLDAALTAPRWQLRLLARADLPTSRNPARGEAGAAFRLGRAWFGELTATGGLTPAAADARASIRVGYRLPLPTSSGGE